MRSGENLCGKKQNKVKKNQTPKNPNQPKTITNNYELWKRSCSQATHSHNIGCTTYYGHADRGTSLSCPENLNKYSKADLICRNLETDKDLWVLKNWIRNQLARSHMMYIEKASIRKKKWTGRNSNNLEIKGNFWLKSNWWKKMNAVIL